MNVQGDINVSCIYERAVKKLLFFYKTLAITHYILYNVDNN